MIDNVPVANATPARVSAGEFLASAETTQLVQLLEGEVVTMAAPELRHQEIVFNLGVILKVAAKAQNGKSYIAPVDLYLDELNIPQPDVVWIAADSLCQSATGKRLVGAPEIIAEVVSLSSAYDDRKRKFRLYERHGVGEYWLVDPRDQLIEVWQLQDERFVLLDVFGMDESFTSKFIGVVSVTAIFES